MIEEDTSKTNIPELGRELLHLPFEHVVPSDTNPRLNLEREPFEELKRSIHANGLLQPIVVRPHGDVYEIIGGHRRYRALQELAADHPADKRFTRVAVVVVDADDSLVPVLQLAENLNRSDLSPIEVADGVARAVATGVPSAQLAQSLGWTKRNLNRYLQLAASPAWFRAYAVEVKVQRKKIGPDGKQVVDAKTGKSLMETEGYPGLPFGDLIELLALYNLLREADALKLEEAGGERFKPQAERVTKRLAAACGSEGWSKNKLRAEIKRVKDPQRESGASPDARGDAQPIVVATDERIELDLRRAAALPLAERGELAAKLTRALVGVGFSRVVITP